MFKHVLIAEDHESISISVRKTLEELDIRQPHYVYYCDDALASVQKKLSEGDPYELLITDLSFDDDGQPQRLKDGVSLIQAAKALQPNLKFLVFTIEQSPAVIGNLFKDQGINGYVCKARHDAQHLKDAIKTVYQGRLYYPSVIRTSLRQMNAHDFTPFDITIISLLSKGMRQKEIPTYLQQNQIRPSSLSSLEKRLNLIKETYGFSNNEQLVALCKDMRLI